MNSTVERSSLQLILVAAVLIFRLSCTFSQVEGPNNLVNNGQAILPKATADGNAHAHTNYQMNVSDSLNTNASADSNSGSGENLVIGRGINNLNNDDSSNNKSIALNWSSFAKSTYYLPSFESEIISLPDAQLKFVRSMVINETKFLKTILREAIDKRNSFAPSASLIWKYSGKVLGNFIRNHQNERRVRPRQEPKHAFFEMLARLADAILERSSIIKEERGYNKNNVDVEDLYNRVDAIFNYIQRIANSSPVGIYHKWDEMVLFKNETWNPYHDKNTIEEGADLVAQFRAMGYESSTFVVKRIISILRMFARGFIPLLKDV